MEYRIDMGVNFLALIEHHMMSDFNTFKILYSNLVNLVDTDTKDLLSQMSTFNFWHLLFNEFRTFLEMLQIKF